MPLKSFQVLTSIMCDEVRREASGKALILGAMPHGPNISDNDDTKVKRLSLYLELQMPVEKINLKIQLKKKDQENPVLHADIDTSDFYESNFEPEHWVINPIAVVIVEREDFAMRGSGDYYLQYSTKDGEWNDVKAIFFPPEEMEVS